VFGAYLRPAMPYVDRASFARDLGRMVRQAGPLEDVGTIPYCDDGAALVGLPDEVARLRCASCVLLAVYEATKAHQRGHRVDICISALPGREQHAWIRVDGVLRDPSAEGGLAVPPSTYEGAVIVPVE